MSVTDLDARTISDALEVMRYGADAARDRARLVRTYAAGRIDYDLRSREVYSYGRHFPLFRYVPRDISGRPDLYVINGDEWRGSNSRTRDHQRAARDRIALTGAASIIVPFSALDGAGISPDSIRPIHVRADANWTEDHPIPADIGARLDDFETADSMREIDDRSNTDWRGLPCDSYGTWRREYVWNCGAVGRITRTIYRQAHTYAGGSGEWRASDDWSAPVSEHAYLNGNHQLTRDAAGNWSYSTNHHRLGDALFSAVRETRETRPADPFETEHETARETVRLIATDGRSSYCGARRETDPNGESAHEAGPSGACVYCDSPLTAQVDTRRRARYLSSFDANENPPLYFLVECPRGCGETVETALDSLAPRAIHAALARGRSVSRQGDIFFIETDLTRDDLTARGATFARLTQWSRDARARRGEVGYVAPMTAADRRRELRHARKLWRVRYRAAVTRATARESIRDGEITRDESRELWRALLARHAAEIRAALDAGASLDAPESSPCSDRGCGAGIGESCGPIFDADGRPVFIHGTRADCRAIPHGRRKSLAARHEEDRENLRRETRRTYRAAGSPFTDAGSRRRWSLLREKHAADVRDARAALRRATLKGPARRPSPFYNESRRDAELRGRIEHIRTARGRLEILLRDGARDSLGHTSRAHGRDDYRKVYGDNARSAWITARHHAAEKYRPGEIAGTGAAMARREKVRRACAIYGTAHGATETATIRGAVYVRGTVRHVPDLETGRNGARDHRPVMLGDGTGWYLAVRNAVPRQVRRRRRRLTGAA